MATLEQRRQLLAVPCPWCRAGVKQECTSNGRPITTLDGGAHDARWRAALGVDAAVVSAAVAERAGDGLELASGVGGQDPQPLALAVAERPW